MENKYGSIKLIQILTGLGIGGLENVVIELVSNLDRRRYESIVCSLDRNETRAGELEKMGIKIIYMDRKPGIDYFLPFRLAKVFKEEKIQIVHTHNSTCYFYGILAAILAKIPILIHTEHGRNFPDKKITMAINRLLSWKVDRIITVSNILRHLLNRYEKISLEKIQVVSNGINSKFFTNNYNKAEIKKRFGFNQEDRLIGIVARLYPIKDHRCLFNAFCFLIKEFPEARLLVIGDGPERGRLEQLALDLKIDKKIIFLGNRQDVPDLLSVLDIFVLSSQNEGMSLTLIEAMASSLPIVATNVGGNSELIKDGVNGTLVSSGNPLSLSQAIIQLLNDGPKARRMGNAGRRVFEELYTVNKMVRNYERIYEYFIEMKLRKDDSRKKLQRWNNYVKQPEGKNFVPGRIGGYYNDLSAKVPYNKDEKDDIPVINYGKNKGFQENAIAVAQMALGCYEIWLTKKDESHKERFLRLADWLVKKQRMDVNWSGIWEFKFDWNYRLKSPWVSAMAQGEGISVLLRAHQMTQEKRYLIAAQRALKPFNYTVEQGGVKSIDEDGSIFFEEYPSVPYSHVLNGFIFALWGLYDYAIYQNDSHARKLFDAGVATLEKGLPRYDLGHWSAYDLYKPYRIRYIANPFYHQLHIAQLRALYRLTRRDIFLQTAEKWEGYQKNIFCRIRFFIHTIAYKAYCKLFNID